MHLSSLYWSKSWGGEDPFIEVFQPIYEEGMEELVHHYFVTPKESIHLGNHPQWLLTRQRERVSRSTHPLHEILLTKTIQPKSEQAYTSVNL